MTFSIVPNVFFYREESLVVLWHSPQKLKTQIEIYQNKGGEINFHIVC